ncbi:MAG TPA: hypothetical protein DEP28_12040 [Bacteroidetes bacterium]|nr:flavin reductase [Ignavibacteria bacterium]HCA43968.1 hypothetical protein [Bacteroidota bacterium]
MSISKKVWNIPDLPVYSLATYDRKSKVNMNICTYVTAISLKPKLYAVAVYEKTKTLKNIKNSDICVLQLLSKSQFNLIKKLGQTSGINFDKENYLNNKNFLEEWENYKVLKNVSGRILLNKKSFQKTGDHYLFIFNVIKSKSYNTDYLNLKLLSEKKLIRI